MRKFIFKVVALAMIMSTLFAGYNSIYQRVKFREAARYTEDKFRDVPYNIQICNFGSSHGDYGIDYSQYDDEYITFNFALKAQMWSYDYRILQQYEDHLADGGVMLITVSNFSLGFDEKSEYHFKYKNEWYYSFLEPQYIKEYSRLEAIKCKYLRVLFEDPDTIISNITRAGQTGEDTYDKGGQDFDYQKDAEVAYERHYCADEKGNITVREEEVEALYGMLEICRKHNIRPILITTPFRDEYNRMFDSKYCKQIHSQINRICKETGAEYYDYSHDARFVHSDKYERNADHLSPEGALYFTEILMNEHIKDKDSHK